MLFSFALSFIVSLTLEKYSYPLLLLSLALFSLIAVSRGLSYSFLLWGIVLVLLISWPVFREFILEKDKVLDYATTGQAFQAEIVTAAKTGKYGRGEAVARLENGPLLAVRGDASYLQAGNVIRLTERLTLPAGQRNPGGFDRREQLQSQGIFLEGKLSRAPEILWQKKNIFTVWQNFTVELQNMAREFFQRNLSSDTAGMVAAICLGRTEDISAAESYEFKESGLIHLLSVSGTHLGFLLLPVNKIKGLNKKLQDGLIFFLLFFFGLVTGWRTGVSRAISMLFVRKYANYKALAVDGISLLSFAGLVLLFDPFRVLQKGYWLSLTATAGIIFGQRFFQDWLQLSGRIEEGKLEELRQTQGFLEKIKRKAYLAMRKFYSVVGKSLIISFTAQLGCLLPLFFWQNGLNPKAIAVNLLAGIPAALVTVIGLTALLVLWPLNFLLPMLARPIVSLFQLLIELPVSWLKLLASSSAGAGGAFTGSGEISWQLKIILLLLSFYFSLAPFRFRFILFLQKGAAFLLLPFIISSLLTKPLALADEIWFLDVGQGDACLIQAGNKVILIDGGERDQGYFTILPFMRWQGIKGIDLALVTHGHSDHCGGIMDLLEQGMIKSLILPKISLSEDLPENDYLQQDLSAELIQIAAAKNVPVSYFARGDYYSLGSDLLELEFLAPSRDWEVKLEKYLSPDPNRDSLIVRLNFRGLRILMTADATEEIEEYLVKANQGELKTDILKVAHHGSKFASGESFLAETQAFLAVISVGENRFGHPAQETLARLKNSGCSEIWRTDERGAIRLQALNKKVRMSTWLAGEEKWIIQN